ncbi:hypothetical protein BGZ96_000711 [Linnemannia gamsii]|uniref:Uncharacterized protein n=1 Tax=Linnemannia gamsii TaxID=64522 RepID=A0ABQ7JNV1_9FUNG|nr:hypothetical protein BGZ96_000711 [Linnemannia gamsii]
MVSALDLRDETDGDNVVDPSNNGDGTADEDRTDGSDETDRDGQNDVDPSNDGDETTDEDGVDGSNDADEIDKTVNGSIEGGMLSEWNFGLGQWWRWSHLKPQVL